MNKTQRSASAVIEPEFAAAPFGEVSAVRRTGEGRYAAEIAPGWDAMGNTDGGYLLAVAARAISEETGRDPVTITAHYLAPVSHGPVVVQTHSHKTGKGLSTAGATLTFEGRPSMVVIGSFGSIEDEAEVMLQDAEPLVLPTTPEESLRVLPQPGQPMPPPFTDKVDIRLHPDDAGFLLSRPSGTAQMRGWFRLGPGQPWDAAGLLLAADAFPPTVFNASLPVNWTPTIELTVHLRALPHTEFVKMQYRTRFIGNGRLEVDGLIWDEYNRLCAQSRQLALVPRASSQAG